MKDNIMAKSRTRRPVAGPQQSQQRSPEQTDETTSQTTPLPPQNGVSAQESQPDSPSAVQEEQEVSNRKNVSQKPTEPPVETVAGETTGTPGQDPSTNVDSDGTMTTSPSADGPGGPITGNTDADHQGNVNPNPSGDNGATQPGGSVEVQSAAANQATADAMEDENDQDKVKPASTVDGSSPDTEFRGGEKHFMTSGSNVPRVAEPEGLILDEDEDLRIEADTYDNYAIVNKDVYRRIYPRNSKRPTFIQLYVKGQQMSLSALQKIG